MKFMAFISMMCALIMFSILYLLYSRKHANGRTSISSAETIVLVATYFVHFITSIIGSIYIFAR